MGIAVYGSGLLQDWRLAGVLVGGATTDAIRQTGGRKGVVVHDEPVDLASDADAAEEFHAFVDRNLSDLGRLAYLLSGDRDSADDLTADALLAAWRQWDRVRAADAPLAYVRGIVANLAGTRVRRLVRERARLVVLRADAMVRTTHGPDSAAVLDVRDALRALPPGRRACVVLRHAFGLSEAETAQVLQVSVGTVKSQTSKGAAQLRRLVSPEAGAGRRTGRSSVPDGSPAGDATAEVEKEGT